MINRANFFMYANIVVLALLSINSASSTSVIARFEEGDILSVFFYFTTVVVESYLLFFSWNLGLITLYFFTRGGIGMPYECIIDHRIHSGKKNAYHCIDCNVYVCVKCYTKRKRLGHEKCPKCGGYLATTFHREDPRSYPRIEEEW